MAMSYTIENAIAYAVRHPGSDVVHHSPFYWWSHVAWESSLGSTSLLQLKDMSRRLWVLKNGSRIWFTAGVTLNDVSGLRSLGYQHVEFHQKAHLTADVINLLLSGRRPTTRDPLATLTAWRDRLSAHLQAERTRSRPAEYAINAGGSEICAQCGKQAQEHVKVTPYGATEYAFRLLCPDNVFTPKTPPAKYTMDFAEWLWPLSERQQDFLRRGVVE